MIEEFTNSALIIDDKESEIKDLAQLLESKEIWTKHYTPISLRDVKAPLKNRKLIFLDLFIDESKTTATDQIGLIRKMLTSIIGLDFGAYGIILWTKHSDQIDEFKIRIQKDAAHYTQPLFIVGMDKTQYLKKGYQTLFVDINAVLKNDSASNFFITWDILVKEGNNEAVRNIYSLVPDYKTQNTNLKFVLFQLAKNYTGIPYDRIQNYDLHTDAYKAFSDMLNYEIANNKKIQGGFFNNSDDIFYQGTAEATKAYEYSVKNYFDDKPDNKIVRKNGTLLTTAQKKIAPDKDGIELVENEVQKIYSEINSKLLIDTVNIRQDTIIPGNVYKVLFAASPFKLDASDLPEGSTPVLIEITPPCDFAQGKMKRPRCIGGFLCDYSKSKKFTKDFQYKEMWPLYINGKATAQVVIFDFRYLGMIDEAELKDAAKYKLIFRTKDKLFADILQKFSSHTARLGLAVIR